MQKWLASVVILALSFVAIGHAQRGRGAGGPPPPPRPVAGHGVEVPGWWARVDDVKEPTTGLKFSPMNGGLHATTGPNIIFWDPQQMASGAYTVKATFTVTKQPSHEVSYGLFIGGADLDTDKQRYSYFLIRENGQFLDQETERDFDEQRGRRLGAQSCHHGDCRRLSEERAVGPGVKGTRQLHGEREGSGQSPGNGDRHQWNRRAADRSRNGYSDRRLRGGGAEVACPACAARAEARALHRRVIHVARGLPASAKATARRAKARARRRQPPRHGSSRSPIVTTAAPPALRPCT